MRSGCCPFCCRPRWRRGWQQNVADVLALLWLSAGSAGAGTLLPWWYDWQQRVQYSHQDAADVREWSDAE